MLKITIGNIIDEINLTIDELEQINVSEKTAIEYLELKKLKSDFEKYLKEVEKKEDIKGEEKNVDEKQGK